jgi:hypothetical protein
LEPTVWDEHVVLAESGQRLCRLRPDFCLSPRKHESRKAEMLPKPPHLRDFGGGEGILDVTTYLAVSCGPPNPTANWRWRRSFGRNHISCTMLRTAKSTAGWRDLAFWTEAHILQQLVDRQVAKSTANWR